VVAAGVAVGRYIGVKEGGSEMESPQAATGLVSGAPSHDSHKAGCAVAHEPIHAAECREVFTFQSVRIQPLQMTHYKSKIIIQNDLSARMFSPHS
jgi:hypothetical protein